MSFLIFSLVGSLFICSFSSIFSAIILIVSTVLLIVVMYWNLMNMIPLYLFSLFIMGGLYVLIGFVMMADENDLSMILSGKKTKEIFFSFMGIALGMNLNNFNGLDLDFSSFSPVKASDWTTWSSLSSTFFFLILVLFIFLFIVHSMMSKSTSEGGFIKR